RHRTGFDEKQVVTDSEPICHPPNKLRTLRSMPLLQIINLRGGDVGQLNLRRMALLEESLHALSVNEAEFSKHTAGEVRNSVHDDLLLHSFGIREHPIQYTAPQRYTGLIILT